MDLVNAMKQYGIQLFTTPKTWVFWVSLILTLITIAGLITAIVYMTQIRATPANIASITNNQLTILNNKYIGSGLKNGLSAVFSEDKTPTDEQCLVNTYVLSTRLAGYLGKDQGVFDNGTFAEDDAVRLALTLGSRCLIIEIDYLDAEPLNPVLLYKNSANGNKTSLNTGSLQKVAQSIASRAFDPNTAPSKVANDPVIVVLYFVRVPTDRMTFMKNTATQLAPLSSILLGTTYMGDSRRQGLASQLFFYNTRLFTKQCILLCNVDTSGFRGTNTPSSQDLDLMVHCRLFAKSSGLGATSVTGATTTTAAIISQPSDWTTLNSEDHDIVKAAVTDTKSKFTICMKPIEDPTNQISQANLTKFYTTYGVQSIPFSLFDSSAVTDKWLGKGKMFNTASWALKDSTTVVGTTTTIKAGFQNYEGFANLRFIPPKPILILAQNPKTNSGGGAVVAPKL